MHQSREILLIIVIGWKFPLIYLVVKKRTIKIYIVDTHTNTYILICMYYVYLVFFFFFLATDVLCLVNI